MIITNEKLINLENDLTLYNDYDTCSLRELDISTKLIARKDFIDEMCYLDPTEHNYQRWDVFGLLEVA